MILIGNGKVFTRDDEKPYIENGAVLIDGNVIKEIGKTEDLKAKYPQAEYKDAKGRRKIQCTASYDRTGEMWSYYCNRPSCQPKCT